MEREKRLSGLLDSFADTDAGKTQWALNTRLRLSINPTRPPDDFAGRDPAPPELFGNPTQVQIVLPGLLGSIGHERLQSYTDSLRTLGRRVHPVRNSRVHRPTFVTPTVHAPPRGSEPLEPPGHWPDLCALLGIYSLADQLSLHEQLVGLCLPDKAGSSLARTGFYCHCVRQYVEKLAEMNGRLSISDAVVWLINSTRMETERLENRQRVVGRSRATQTEVSSHKVNVDLSSNAIANSELVSASSGYCTSCPRIISTLGPPHKLADKLTSPPLEQLPSVHDFRTLFPMAAVARSKQQQLLGPILITSIETVPEESAATNGHLILGMGHHSSKSSVLGSLKASTEGITGLVRGVATAPQAVIPHGDKLTVPSPLKANEKTHTERLPSQTGNVEEIKYPPLPPFAVRPVTGKRKLSFCTPNGKVGSLEDILWRYSSVTAERDVMRVFVSPDVRTRVSARATTGKINVPARRYAGFLKGCGGVISERLAINGRLENFKGFFYRCYDVPIGWVEVLTKQNGSWFYTLEWQRSKLMEKLCDEFALARGRDLANGVARRDIGIEYSEYWDSVISHRIREARAQNKKIREALEKEYAERKAARSQVDAVGGSQSGSRPFGTGDDIALTLGDFYFHSEDVHGFWHRPIYSTTWPSYYMRAPEPSTRATQEGKAEDESFLKRLSDSSGGSPFFARGGRIGNRNNSNQDGVGRDKASKA